MLNNMETSQLYGRFDFSTKLSSYLLFYSDSENTNPSVFKTSKTNQKASPPFAQLKKVFAAIFEKILSGSLLEAVYSIWEMP